MTPMKSHPHHGLKLDLAVRADAKRRLQSIRVHVEGILRMLEEDGAYCVDVLKQIKAVEGALGRVGDLVLRSHLAEHVMTAAARGDESRMVDELMELLKYR